MQGRWVQLELPPTLWVSGRNHAIALVGPACSPTVDSHPSWVHAIVMSVCRQVPIINNAVLIRWREPPDHGWLSLWDEGISGELRLETTPGTHAGLVEATNSQELAETSGAVNRRRALDD